MHQYWPDTALESSQAIRCAVRLLVIRPSHAVGSGQIWYAGFDAMRLAIERSRVEQIRARSQTICQQFNPPSACFWGSCQHMGRSKLRPAQERVDHVHFGLDQWIRNHRERWKDNAVLQHRRLALKLAANAWPFPEEPRARTKPASSVARCRSRPKETPWAG